MPTDNTVQDAQQVSGLSTGQHEANPFTDGAAGNAVLSLTSGVHCGSTEARDDSSMDEDWDVRPPDAGVRDGGDRFTGTSWGSSAARTERPELPEP